MSNVINFYVEFSEIGFFFIFELYSVMGTICLCVKIYRVVDSIQT